MEWWSFGVMEWWSGGVVERRSFGVMEFWSGGVLERISVCSLPRKTFGIRRWFFLRIRDNWLFRTVSKDAKRSKLYRQVEIICFGRCFV
jgi:hypothetical protein